MPRVTRAEAREQTRARLLAAAGEVFAERGFSASTVEEIVDRAGYTRGAFYANFADKADAFLTLLEETRRADMARIADIIATTPDGEKLAAMQSWYDSLRDERWERAYAELAPQAAANPSLQARMAAREREVREVIADVLRAYLEAEGIALPVPADTVAAMILAIGDGVAHQRHLEPDAVPGDLFTTTIAYLWFGLSAPPA